MQRKVMQLLVAVLFATVIYAQGAGGRGGKGMAFLQVTTTPKADGEWRGQWNGTAVTLKLQSAGQTLTGTMKYEVSCAPECRPDTKTTEAVADITDGQIAGDKIEFKCEIGSTRGSSTVTFKGVVQADQVILTPQSPANETPFTLQRK
jgi:hypothetical protein